MSKLQETNTTEYNFLQLLTSPIHALTYSQQIGLLPKTRLCKRCSETMKIQQYKSLDGWRWSCYKNKCDHYTINLRSGTIFENSKLSIGVINVILHEWSTNNDIMRTAKIVKVSKKTIAYWFNKIRTLIYQYRLLKVKKIGGVNKIVEIDETLISKRKYNKGRMQNQV